MMRTSLLPAVRRSAPPGAALVLTLAGVAAAQQPNASVAAAGLGGNFTAMARGYDAVAWNPATLGLPGNPHFSIAIAPFGGTASLTPINLSDVNAYSGKTVPASVRRGWLDLVTAKGGEKGELDGGL